MLGRQTSGSVLCPSCGSLVGVNDASCLTCGRRRPGLWGFASLLRHTGEDMGFLTIVMFMCGALYIASLAASGGLSGGGGGGGVLNLLAPNSLVLLRFGMTGSLPVFGLDRWWTILSAGWLHGSVLHIVFNMMAARNLIPPIAHFYGPARTIIIYTVACASGALATSSIAYANVLPPGRLHGAVTSIGASGAIFGLLGALVYYSRRGGNRALGEIAWRWAISGLILGFAMPNVDNWNHLGGFAGGYLASRLLDPLKPERGDHVIVAILCLIASAASIVASLLIDVPLG